MSSTFLELWQNQHAQEKLVNETLTRCNRTLCANLESDLFFLPTGNPLKDSQFQSSELAFSMGDRFSSMGSKFSYFLTKSLRIISRDWSWSTISSFSRRSSFLLVRIYNTFFSKIQSRFRNSPTPFSSTRCTSAMVNTPIDNSSSESSMPARCYHSKQKLRSLLPWKPKLLSSLNPTVT